ncbi:hypothetical protein CAI21_18635 [Alkalilimnicola ehrlichii]|nr:hypothetical protein CAI21_18635 [Alkalilimnicola ehrlichii]
MTVRSHNGNVTIQAARNIRLTGRGGGDITVEQSGAGFSVKADGTVRLFGNTVTLKADQGVTFNGPVSYEVPGSNQPERVSVPPSLQPVKLADIAWIEGVGVPPLSQKERALIAAVYQDAYSKNRLGSLQPISTAAKRGLEMERALLDDAERRDILSVRFGLVSLGLPAVETAMGFTPSGRATVRAPQRTITHIRYGDLVGKTGDVAKNETVNKYISRMDESQHIASHVMVQLTDNVQDRLADIRARQETLDQRIEQANRAKADESMPVTNMTDLQVLEEFVGHVQVMHRNLVRSDYAALESMEEYKARQLRLFGIDGEHAEIAQAVAENKISGDQGERQSRMADELARGSHNWNSLSQSAAIGRRSVFDSYLKVHGRIVEVYQSKSYEQMIRAARTLLPSLRETRFQSVKIMDDYVNETISALQDARGMESTFNWDLYEKESLYELSNPDFFSLFLLISPASAEEDKRYLYSGFDKVATYLLSEDRDILNDCQLIDPSIQQSQIGGIAHIAAELKLSSAMEELHHCGFDLDQKNQYELTPTALAIMLGDWKTVSALLALGVDADGVMESTTYLGAAIHSSIALEADCNEHARVAIELLEAGANPNAEGADGFTALYTAVLRDHEGWAETLLAYGADPDQFVRRPGETARQAAVIAGSEGWLKKKAPQKIMKRCHSPS